MTRGSFSLFFATAMMAGCTAQFIVGESGGSSSGDTGGDAGVATNIDSDGVGSDDTNSGDPPTTSGATSSTDTGGVESTGGESGAVETSGETTPETGVEAGSVETGGVTESGGEEGDPTGDPITPCAEPLDAPGCEEDWHCDWFGGDFGNCWHDPCVEGVAMTCNGLDFDVCSDAPVCIWIGDEGSGECTYPDCSALEMAQCLDAPACAWVEEQCIDLDCEPCSRFAMEQCMTNEACQWVEGEAFCAAS
jgi:hypothetical protein